MHFWHFIEIVHLCASIEIKNYQALGLFGKEKPGKINIASINIPSFDTMFLLRMFSETQALQYISGYKTHVTFPLVFGDKIT